MTDIRNAINKGIESYKNTLESPSDTYNTSSGSSLLSRILWYTFTAILVCLLIVWIVYSVGDDNMKHSIQTYIEYIVHTFKENTHNVYSSVTTSTPITSETSTHQSDTSNVHPDNSTPYSPDTLQYSNIEKETQAINTALNFTPPEITQSNNTFQNDDPDSSIQRSRPNESQGLWWYIDGDNGVSDSSLPLPNVYTPSKNTNPL